MQRPSITTDPHIRRQHSICRCMSSQSSSMICFSLVLLGSPRPVSRCSSILRKVVLCSKCNVCAKGFELSWFCCSCLLASLNRFGLRLEKGFKSLICCCLFSAIFIMSLLSLFSFLWAIETTIGDLFFRGKIRSLEFSNGMNINCAWEIGFA